MPVNVDLENGIRAELVAEGAERGSLYVSAPAPPGSTLRGQLAGDAHIPVAVKVQRCKLMTSNREPALYHIEGRFVNLTRDAKQALGLQ